MKTKLSIMALAAVMLFTGCEAYVVEHRRPTRSYAYSGHRYYRDHDDRYYGQRRYTSYRRPVSYGYSSRPYSYGSRRGYYRRPSTTVVVDTPVIRGSVRRWR